MKYGRENRIQRAIERQKIRNKKSNEEQIATLDKRLGIGVGAVKERAKLNNIDKNPVAVSKNKKPKKQKIEK